MVSKIRKLPSYMKKRRNNDSTSTSTSSIDLPKLQTKSKQLSNKCAPKYFSNRLKISGAKERDLVKEPSPYKYPHDISQFSHEKVAKIYLKFRQVQDLNCKYNEKHNLRSRNQAEIPKRLYVKDSDAKNIKTIVDLDPTFFEYCKRLPEKQTIREQIQSMREVIRMKIGIGYKEDDTLLIEENLMMEQQVIDEINKNYQTYVDGFEEFLSNEHSIAMKAVSEAEQIHMLSLQKYEEYKELSKQYASLRLAAYNREEEWCKYKSYQKFLYSVSPLSWRIEHDPYYKHKNETILKTESLTIIQKPKQDVSLRHLLQQFMEDPNNFKKPLLYFTDPQQFLDVFKYAERTNLEHVLKIEEFVAPLQNIKHQLKEIEELCSKEINSLQVSIKKLSKAISWYEKRGRILKKLAMELINKVFKKIMTDEDSLNLYVLVEDFYEKRIAPNDADLSMSEMMTTIETRFGEEMMKLEKVSRSKFKKAEISMHEKEARNMKIAKKAARELFNLERIFRNLNGVFSPPIVHNTKELKWRSPPINPPKRIPPPPRSLTQNEKDYLTFFTDYCRYTDNLIDYGIDRNKPIKKHNFNDETNKSIISNRLSLKPKDSKRVSVLHRKSNGKC